MFTNILLTIGAHICIMCSVLHLILLKTALRKGEKMFRTVVKIDGMMCGMCEAHINDAIRRNFNVKKVKSSHSKGETVIESETEPDAAALKRAIEETGYEFISASTKIIEGRRGLFAGILHKD